LLRRGFWLAAMGDLAHELMVSGVLVALTVVVHLAGLDLLLSLTRLHLRLFTTAWVHLDRLVVPLGIVMGLFALHGIEIWLYAFAYRILGVLPDLEQALYFSVSAYSTLGEAPALPHAWRVVGVLEGINGMLLLGWSTAFVFHILDHLLAGPGGHPLPKGAIARERPDAAPPEDP
jgi:voltage-gated potassium channel